MLCVLPVVRTAIPLFGYRTVCSVDWVAYFVAESFADSGIFEEFFRSQLGFEPTRSNYLVHLRSSLHFPLVSRLLIEPEDDGSGNYNDGQDDVCAATIKLQ